MQERLEVGGERWEELVFLIFHIQPLSFIKMMSIWFEASRLTIPGPTDISDPEVEPLVHYGAGFLIESWFDGA